MKLFINYLLVFLAVIGLGLFSACSDEVNPETKSGSSEEKTVTLTIYPESMAFATREGNDINDEYSISRGDLVDALIFAVYKKNPEYETDNTKPEYITTDKFKKTTQQSKGCLEAGDGQNILPINPGSWPITLSFSFGVDESETINDYKILFWAQNSSCDAYDTKDLTAVKVKYSYEDEEGNTKYYLNNDETRDAFAGKIEVLKDGAEVILHRPFAQINIGTAGWDWEGKALLNPNPKIFMYSKVIISDVADTYNVETGLSSTSQIDEEGRPKYGNAIFDFNTIPAYIHDEDEDALKNNGAYIDNLSQWQLNDYLIKNGLKENDNVPSPELFKEEFLKINLDWDTDKTPIISPYIGWYMYKYMTDEEIKKANQEQDKSLNNLVGNITKAIETETFKYVSMCYVLVPNATNTTVGVTYECTTADKVKKLLGIDDSNADFGNDSKEEGGIFSFHLKNVPVFKNYRTNIVPGAGAGFYMTTSQLDVNVYTEDFGDFYKRLRAKDSQWSEEKGKDNIDEDGNKYHGEEDNDGYDWPDKDIYPYEVPDMKTPIIIGDDSWEWNPLKPLSVTNDYAFTISSLELSEEDKKANLKYRYKVWVIMNGLERELDVKEESGKYVVTVPGDVIIYAYTNSKSLLPVYAKIINTATNYAISDVSSSSLNFTWDLSKKWAWVFGGGDEDNLKGSDFLTDKFADMDGNEEPVTLNDLTATAKTNENGGKRQIKKDNTNKALNLNGGSKTYGNLSFTLTSSSKVTVSYKATGTSNERYAYIDYDGNEGEPCKSELATTSGFKQVSMEIILNNSESTTVYVYVSGGNMYIESIKLESVK